MKHKLSWTTRLDDGIKCEVRVEAHRGSIRWQRKRSDEEKWTYDITPTAEEWDYLEDFLGRRAARGRDTELLKGVKKMRLKAEG